MTTSSIQYESDDVMRPVWGDDYSICCCVSATQTGKEMQFFGARANLAKALLYAINGGKDEEGGLVPGMQIGPELAPITGDVLNYDEVMHKYDMMLEWLAGIYVNTLNLIHYMHDKYYYEAAELALIDTDVRRTFATGIAGFSHVVDSLCAIKYAKVSVVRGENGLVKDFKIEGDFPKYGNDDDRADEMAVWLLKEFIAKIKKHHTYRGAEPTTSILTITSNVVYGKATGALPDGRPAHVPVQTRATVPKRTASWPRSTLSPSSRTNTRSTVSATRRPSARTRSATATTNAPRSLSPSWTVTSPRAHTT